MAQPALNQMPFLLSPLVGSYFHPPAKTLLSRLPAGTELYLEPEPDNQYDSNAIMVLLSFHETEKLLSIFKEDEDFNNELLSCGWSLTQIEELGENAHAIHLGYIAASLKTSKGHSLNTQFLPILQGTSNWSAELTFDTDGTYLVKLTWT